MKTSKRALPLLPLRGIQVFPYMVIHLDVGRPKSIAAMEEAMAQNKQLLLVAQRDPRVDEPQSGEIYQMGTVAEIKQLLKIPGGTMRVLVEGLARGEIISIEQTDPFYLASCQEYEENEPAFWNAKTEALMRGIIFLFEKYVQLSKKIPAETVVSIVTVKEPGRLADLIGAHLNLKQEDKQRLLEAVQLNERLEILYSFLSRELEILELERKISARVREQMEKSQREYYLREQLKAIQAELGDDREEEINEAREIERRIDQVSLPAEVYKKAKCEVERFKKMPPMAAEAVVVRTYLDWLLALPWTKTTPDRLDLDRAEQILNEDHYGLKKVKERILEYLAVRKLAASMKGPILCLVGPPGVGKTSLAKSIARAIDRRFVRISLGGVRDEAEIRGHRRTYVGALPGRILQGMRQADSNNPVFLLDEIDKISMDFRGDPSAALLEVLDPEQNHAFSDHYIELPFNLSHTMFITTANTTYNIPPALLDRMEVIRLPGYTEEEKLHIGRSFLQPKQLKAHGLKPSQLKLSDNTIRGIIREYTREAGVRNLERAIAGLCRKAAREIVQGKKEKVHITSRNLSIYLGPSRFRSGMPQQKDEIGVATGLVWTEVGGDVLNIEVSVINGKGRLMLTGQLGDVMRESAQAGCTYIRSRASALGIRADFSDGQDVHIHVPEGAIPKDGPSAGITMATALASALSGRPVRAGVAMTGEITLRGRVLPVGGIKEKVLAAHRAGLKTVILPQENRRDLSEIPRHVQRKLNFVLVENMDQVLEQALTGSAEP
ncbi:MAG: endopeptidase La [Firmicutes bacterium]|nr:endopeptidase La [Bacillota bacterium]